MPSEQIRTLFVVVGEHNLHALVALKKIAVGEVVLLFDEDQLDPRRGKRAAEALEEVILRIGSVNRLTLEPISFRDNCRAEERLRRILEEILPQGAIGFLGGNLGIVDLVVHAEMLSRFGKDYYPISVTKLAVGKYEITLGGYGTRSSRTIHTDTVVSWDEIVRLNQYSVENGMEPSDLEKRFAGVFYQIYASHAREFLMEYLKSKPTSPPSNPSLKALADFMLQHGLEVKDLGRLLKNRLQNYVIGILQDLGVTYSVDVRMESGSPGSYGPSWSSHAGRRVVAPTAGSMLIRQIDIVAQGAEPMILALTTSDHRKMVQADVLLAIRQAEYLGLSAKNVVVITTHGDPEGLFEFAMDRYGDRPIILGRYQLKDLGDVLSELVS